MKNKQKMIYLGRHMGVSKGIINAIQTSIDNGLYTCQIFVGSPQSAVLSKIPEEDKIVIKEIILKNGFHLQSHFKYIYNFSNNCDPKQWQLQTIKKELKLADEIGALTGVIHMGKAVKLDKEKAIDNFIKSVKHICNYIKTEKLKIKLALETSVGAGSEMFSRIEDFAEMFNSFTIDEKKYLKVCIDTAHVFSAGHDLINEGDKFINYIKKNIGIKYIGLIHLNDSKIKLGGKVDRHESLGFGYIGYNPLEKIAKFAADNKIDIILETPTTTLENSMNECKKMLKKISKI
jgi:deoxyribonuclease-4